MTKRLEEMEEIENGIGLEAFLADMGQGHLKNSGMWRSRAGFGLFVGGLRENVRRPALALPLK